METISENVRDRYEIHQPFTLDGKMAPTRRTGPPFFFIWDRQRRQWIDAAFTTRAAAEHRVDELTNSVGVVSEGRRPQALPPPEQH